MGLKEGRSRGDRSKRKDSSCLEEARWRLGDALFGGGGCEGGESASESFLVDLCKGKLSHHLSFVMSVEQIPALQLLA